MTLGASTRPLRKQLASGMPAARFAVKAVVLLVAITWLIPTTGLLISSFRTRTQILESGWWQALTHAFDFRQWTLGNYQQVLGSEGMGNAFVNSLVVAIPSTVIPVAVAMLAGYGFAWMEFKGRRVLFSIMVGLMVVPAQMALIPLLRLFVGLDLNGTFFAVWLAHTGFGLPLAIYLFRNYIGSLPRSLIESAAVDGASHLTTFVRLVLPLSVPIIASFAIFQFLWVWNDLLVALVFLGGTQDVAVLTLRLSELVGSRGEDWHLLTAGAFITMTLPLAVFFSLQRYFVRGLIAGSVKG